MQRIFVPERCPQTQSNPPTCCSSVRTLLMLHTLCHLADSEFHSAQLSGPSLCLLPLSSCLLLKPTQATHVACLFLLARAYVNNRERWHQCVFMHACYLSQSLTLCLDVLLLSSGSSFVLRTLRCVRMRSFLFDIITIIYLGNKFCKKNALNFFPLVP